MSKIATVAAVASAVVAGGLTLGGQGRGRGAVATMTRSVLRATFDAQGHPTGQERMLTELEQRFRDIRTGPDGALYLLTDETVGAVLRMTQAS